MVARGVDREEYRLTVKWIQFQSKKTFKILEMEGRDGCPTM